MPHFSDQSVRLATFSWLSEQTRLLGDVLPRTLLSQGFTFEGRRVPLVGPQGIFKPAVIQKIPLSITTAPSGPYADSFGPDGLLNYKYRGTDPQHHENVGLREAMRTETPLVYFHGLVKGKYLAVWPVYIVGDNPSDLSFTVAVDDAQLTISNISKVSSDSIVADSSSSQSRRAYITTTVRQRLHQRGFRERVIAAYQERCALCNLRHTELLDAAHITPDSDPLGEPVVSNGLALCKLHHAAFDKMFIGIRPDYQIVVRADIMQESDGPMLLHGLQEMNGRKIYVPRKLENKPDPQRLEDRWELFRNAG